MNNLGGNKGVKLVSCEYAAKTHCLEAVYVHHFQGNIGF